MAISEAIPQNPGNFRFEARPKLKYFCDWSIEKGQNFEPIKIQNLSKSGRKFLVLGQVCCPFSRCKMAEIQRFYRGNSEYIESLINASENKNTKDSTRNWLKQFEKWAVERKKEVNLEKYAAEELNSTLCEFFAELRKANGDDYELDVWHNRQTFEIQELPQINQGIQYFSPLPPSFGRKGQKATF